MSMIVETDLGRFRAVSRDGRKGWLWECPCDEWLPLTERMMNGLESVNHAAQGCRVGYHETHPFAIVLVSTIQARALTQKQVFTDESP